MVKKRKKAVISSLAAATLLFASLGGAMIGASADGAAVAQSATALEQKTYSIDWETLYGENGFVVIGDANKTYYSDMYEGSDGTAALTTSSWTYTSANFTDFTAKSTAPISTLSYGTVVWDNKGEEALNLYKPGTNKTEKLKLRAGRNPVSSNGGNSSYYADVFAGFTLKEDSEIYVTANVTDKNKKVSESHPITISVYASSVTKMNAEAYVNNEHPDRYQLIDDFYAGKGGSALASTTVTQQSANVTFKLQGKGEYRIVAYYNNPTAVDAEGNMVTTGEDSPLRPQINGFFFDKEEPKLDAVSFDTTTCGNWEGVYGSDAYVLFTSSASDNNSNQAYTKGIYTGKDNELITYWSTEGTDSDCHNPKIYNAGQKGTYALKGAGESDGFLEETGYLAKYYFASSTWKTNGTKTNALRIPGGGVNDLASFDSGNGSGQEVSSFAFDVSESAFAGKSAVYVTVYNYNTRNADIDADFNVYLYRGYYPNCGRTVSAGGNMLLWKNTINTNAKNGFYTTFKITAPGEYTVYVEGADSTDCGTAKSHAGGSICGVFFDTYVEPTIASASLTLDGTIGLNFYAKTNNAENAAMRVTYADGTTETVNQPETLTDGYYKFTAKVLPKNYAKKVKAELLSGSTVLDVAEYSVKDYCDYVAAHSTDERLKALCASLMTYGAAADNYFNEAENELTLSEVTAEALKGYQATAEGTAPEGVTVNNISLIIESETTIRLYLTAPEGVQVKVNGAEAEIKTDGDGSYIEIKNIAAKDLDNVNTIEIGENYTIKCSALTYAYTALSKSGNQTLLNAVKALYLYNQAANAYFA